MTHELIANMSRVRLDWVNKAAGKLQELSVVRCRRDRIPVRERPKCCVRYRTDDSAMALFIL